MAHTAKQEDEENMETEILKNVKAFYRKLNAHCGKLSFPFTTALLQ